MTEDKWYQYVIEHGSMDVYVSLHAYGNRKLAERYAERWIDDKGESEDSGWKYRIRPVILTPDKWEPEDADQ